MRLSSFLVRSFDRFFFSSSSSSLAAAAEKIEPLIGIARRRLQLHMYEGWFDEAVLAPSRSEVTLTEGKEAGGKGGGATRHKSSFSVRVVQTADTSM